MLTEIDELWSSKEVGAFVKMPPNKVTSLLQYAPGFPQAVRIPLADGRKMHPRWIAGEIREWVLNQRGGSL